MRKFLVMGIAMLSFGVYQGANAKEVLRFAYYLNPTHTYAAAAFEPFAKEVASATDGRIQINTFPSGQLGKSDASIRLLQTGIADIAFVATPYHGEELTLSQFYNLPLGLKGSELAPIYWRAVHEPGKIKEELQKLGLRVLLVVANPSYELQSKSKKYMALADLKGQKIRIPGPAYAEFLKDIGAIPTEIASTEQYEAIERNLIDATIYTISSWSGFKLNEVLHTTTTNLNIVSAVLTVAMNERKFAALDSKDQEILVDLGRKYSEEGQKAIEREATNAMKRYVEEDSLQTYKWSDEEVEKLDGYLSEIREHWVADAKSKGYDSGALVEEFERMEKNTEADNFDFKKY